MTQWPDKLYITRITQVNSSTQLVETTTGRPGCLDDEDGDPDVYEAGTMDVMGEWARDASSCRYG